MEQDLQQGLLERKEQSLYRNRRQLSSPQGPEVEVDGKRLLSFCSNDYLGLANHPELAEAMITAVKRYGVGSGASHLVCGHTDEHHALEQELAAFTGRDRAVLFSTGYMANQGVITALLGKADYIFEDKLNHASLLDGGLLSGARFQRFLHNDLENLEGRLARAGDGRKLIAVDGVFSMDGDQAPLPGLAAMADKYDATLLVDDAHGLGVLGENGGGSIEAAGLSQHEVPLLMGTLGKAVGVFGAFVAGSDSFIDHLIQHARSYIYTTALPPAVAAAARASLKVQAEEGWRREHLAHLVSSFRAGASDLGLPLMHSASPIQPLMVGDSERAIALSQKLEELGFWITAIRPPTVATGSARLRITLSAAHSLDQVEQLLAALKKVVQ
ncbi:MAG: 8-amino-7-oxononanoate synthase [Pseudomonadales bacterium]